MVSLNFFLNWIFRSEEKLLLGSIDWHPSIFLQNYASNPHRVITISFRIHNWEIWFRPTFGKIFKVFLIVFFFLLMVEQVHHGCTWSKRISLLQHWLTSITLKMAHGVNSATLTTCKQPKSCPPPPRFVNVFYPTCPFFLSNVWWLCIFISY